MKKNPSPEDQINLAVQRLLTADSWLKSYEKIIRRRLQKIAATEQRLTRGKTSLADFALGHAYFGLHFKDNQWVFREWAPNATAILKTASGKYVLRPTPLITVTFTACESTGPAAWVIASLPMPGAWSRIRNR
jgi:hypothetical protein